MAKLIWSPRSLKDLEIIFEYIKPDSIYNARNFINQLTKIAANIPDFPLAGREAPEYKKTYIREKLYKRYRLIYRIDKDIIEIITVVHQSKRIIIKES